jgi:hypothetical protein
MDVERGREREMKRHDYCKLALSGGLPLNPALSGGLPLNPALSGGLPLNPALSGGLPEPSSVWRAPCAQLCLEDSLNPALSGGLPEHSQDHNIMVQSQMAAYSL